ncbi:ATP-binding protein [Pseudonocardia kujensis]|uniref:ATP-binding protein n=1 Tax=Pseudonocardia kujensis TaxID=1128675 RepID=UPI001E30989F|nr:ATP-binding protein [Pseudonocardia kujensis]MCE0764405.1 ATP-binding protein [Pseudonocardia kujensis]
MFEANEEPAAPDGSWLFEPPTELTISSTRWQMTGPALQKVLYPMRASLTQWLRSVGYAAGPASEIVAAADEAVSNVVLHAYAQVVGLVWADAELVGEPRGRRVSLTVADRGSWRPVEGRTPLGIGLELIEELMDEVSVRPSTTSFDAQSGRRMAHLGAQDRHGTSPPASGLPGAGWFTPGTSGTVVRMLSPVSPVEHGVGIPLPGLD